MTDPVFQNLDDPYGLWYFWAEDWCTSYGPYDTEAIARAALKSYIHWLNTGEVIDLDGLA